MSRSLTIPADEAWVFLKRWARNPLQLGSVFPSSKALSAFMAGKIECSDTNYVVEIGGGTGSISRAILAAGIPENRLIVVELDAELALFLKKSLPAGVRVIQGNAEKLHEILPQEVLGCVSTVISGLPLRNFPKTVQTNIIEAAFRVMGSCGSILQYTYGLTSPLKSNAPTLQQKKMGTIFRNLPPATVWKFWR